MLRPSNPPRRPRRGVILIVVLALLALFAVIGISFVFYADSEANAARIHREGAARNDNAPPDATQIVNVALSSLLFDSDHSGVTGGGSAPSTPTGVTNNNPLRGHSILRSMYGCGLGQTAHTLPYNGIGTFHDTSVDLSTVVWPPPSTTPYAIPDSARWVNFTTIPFPAVTPTTPTNIPVNLDPEWTGSNLTASTSRHYVGKNAPQTYPDLANFYLASISPATGEVLVPSFHRDWLFNGPFSPNPTNGNLAGGTANPGLRLAPYAPVPDPYCLLTTPGNTDWISPEGRTRILRPRPVDQLTTGLTGDLGRPFQPYPNTADPTAGAGLPGGIIPVDIAYNTSPQYDIYRKQLAAYINARIAKGEIIGYPAPNADGSYTGDLQNVTGGVGRQRNDSILLDFGQTPIPYQGKYIQPLVSLMIIDHEGRVQLDSHGNLRNAATAGASSHQSFAGIGPHEVNPRRVFDPTLSNVTSLTDYRAMLDARYNTGGAGGLKSRSQISSLKYDRSGVQLPAASLVNWDATSNNYVSLYMPGFYSVPPTGFRTIPAYSGNGWDSNGTTEANGHPALFNPADWASTPVPGLPVSGRLFDPLDFRRLNFRYAPAPELNRTLDVGGYAQTFVRGPLVILPVPGNPNWTNYRIDVSHPVRWMLTPRGSGLDYPALSPQFVDVTSTSGTTGGMGMLQLQYSTGTAPSTTPPLVGITPTTPQLTSTAFTAPLTTAAVTPGSVTDLGNATSGTSTIVHWRNLRAILGPVDLNRPLTDYREDTTLAVDRGNVFFGPKPTNPTAPSNGLIAWADRHNLAKDIFARLIVATGAAAEVDANGNVRLPQPGAVGAGGTYTLTLSSGTTATVTAAQFNALRYLAQIAVNTVDYIDKDDVSTPFLWNPTGGVLGSIGDQSVLATFTTFPYVNGVDPATMSPIPSDFDPSKIGDRAVFGVEKPKLVINEAYAEIANNPEESSTPLGGGKAGGYFTSAEVRFWVELLNPGSAPYTNTTGLDPLGDGSARLRYYPPPVDPVSTVLNYSPYKIMIAPSTTMRAALINEKNVTGGWAGLGITAPPIEYDFDDVNITAATGNQPRQAIIKPNNGTYRPTALGNRNEGIVMVGPTVPATSQGVNKVFPRDFEFNPMNNLGMGGPPVPWLTMIESQDVTGRGLATPPLFNSMSYRTPLPKKSLLISNQRNHVVMLRRLANPYLPPNDPTYVAPNIPLTIPATPPYNPALPPNPYITVDCMDDVAANDAVYQPGQDLPADDGSTPRNGPRPPSNMTTTDPQGYVDMDKRFAVGKIQPFAGYAFTTAVTNDTQAAPTSAQFNTGTFSCILQQQPNPPAMQSNANQTALEPRHTFGRHNGQNDGLNTPAPNQSTLQIPAGTNPTLLNYGNVPPSATETAAVPFDWFIHLDRPLANQAELKWVQAVKPHMVTQMYWYPPVGPTNKPGTTYPPRKDVGLVPWHQLDTNLTTSGNDNPAPFNYNQTGHGMFRALEMLKIKPYTFGVPVGGKLHGRININTLQDYRVLLALLDPPTDMTNSGTPGFNGNMFDMYDVYKNNAPNELWNRFLPSRTGNIVMRSQPDGTQIPVPVPGPTYDDIGASGSQPYAGYPAGTIGQVDPRAVALDRPVKSFGTVEFGAPTPGFTWSAGGGSAFSDSTSTPNLTRFGPGLKDTLLRTFDDPADTRPPPPPVLPNTPTGKPQVPRLWLDPTSANPSLAGVPNALDRTHPYYRSEAARKLFNNTTTVSNTFTVMMTVVFYEVRTDPIQTWIVLTDPTTGRPLLKRELYKEVPGDLRQQYFAQVDRTNATIKRQDIVSIDMAGNKNTATTYTVGPRPFFTTLESQVVPPNPTGTPPQPYYTIQVAAVQDQGTNNVVSVMADGQAMPLNVGDPLYLGTGAEMEGVQIQSVVSYTGGAATLLVTPLSGGALNKPHAIGTAVSNVAVGIQSAANVPLTLPGPGTPGTTYVQVGNTIGNIGPQTGGAFKYWLPEYQPVLPYVIRLR